MIGPAYVTHQAAYRSQRRVLKQFGREMAVEECQLSVRTSAAASGELMFTVHITAFGLGHGQLPDLQLARGQAVIFAFEHGLVPSRRA
jgi:hypothetical protein